MLEVEALLRICPPQRWWSLLFGRVPHGRQRLAYGRQLGVLNLNHVYNLTFHYDKLLTLMDVLRLVIEFVSPILPNLRYISLPLAIKESGE